MPDVNINITMKDWISIFQSFKIKPVIKLHRLFVISVGVDAEGVTMTVKFNIYDSNDNAIEIASKSYTFASDKMSITVEDKVDNGFPNHPQLHQAGVGITVTVLFCQPAEVCQDRKGILQERKV